MNSEGLLKQLDELFATVTKNNHIDDPEDCIRILDNLDRLNDVMCLAASISAYLQTLNNRFSKNTHLKAIANEIYANVNHWLSCLFRFHNSNLYLSMRTLLIVDRFLSLLFDFFNSFNARSRLINFL